MHKYRSRYYVTLGLLVGLWGISVVAGDLLSGAGGMIACTA